MAELPQMPWFPRDYQADTRHLTLEEHGAYRTLLDLLWIGNCTGLPSDDKRLARMLGVTVREWKKISPEVMPFFYEKEDGLISNSRIEKEWERVSSRVEQNRQNAKAKSQKNNKTSLANAQASGKAKTPSNTEQNDSKTHNETPLTQNQNQKEGRSTTTTTESSSAPVPDAPADGCCRSDDDPLAIPKFLDRRGGADPGPGENPGPGLRKRPSLVEQCDMSEPLPDHPGKPVCEAYMAVVNEVFGTRHLVTGAPHGTAVVGERWLKSGASLELIVESFRAGLQTLKDQGQQPPRSNWKYFEPIVSRLVKEADKPMAEAGGGRQSDVTTHPDSENAVWTARVKGYKNSNFWLDSYGSRPDEPGCDAPVDILAEFGYGEDVREAGE